MTIEEVTAAIERFIRRQFDVGPADPDFNQDVHLFDFGYVDSFGAVELTTFVESEFGIVVTNSDLVLYPMNSISEIAEFVVRRKKGEV